jgi:hypothetical protein
MEEVERLTQARVEAAPLSQLIRACCVYADVKLRQITWGTASGKGF